MGSEQKFGKLFAKMPISCPLTPCVRGSKTMGHSNAATAFGCRSPTHAKDKKLLPQGVKKFTDKFRNLRRFIITFIFILFLLFFFFFSPNGSARGGKIVFYIFF